MTCDHCGQEGLCVPCWEKHCTGNAQIEGPMMKDKLLMYSESLLKSLALASLILILPAPVAFQTPSLHSSTKRESMSMKMTKQDRGWRFY